jgi:hypothetical protein
MKVMYYNYPNGGQGKLSLHERWGRYNLPEYRFCVNDSEIQISPFNLPKSKEAAVARFDELAMHLMSGGNVNLEPLPVSKPFRQRAIESFGRGYI